MAIQNLPVMFAVDRGGLVGADGPTHHGVFDLAYFRSIPNLTVMVPSDENETRLMLTTAFRMKTPAAVRYPRGKGPGVALSGGLETIEIGKSRTLRESGAEKGKRVAFLAFGSMVNVVRPIAEKLDATLIDMRFVKPLDTEAVLKAADIHDLLVTAEEGVAAGGAGSAVLECLSGQGRTVPVLVKGIADRFIDHGDMAHIMKEAGIDAETIERDVRARLAAL